MEKIVIKKKGRLSVVLRAAVRHGDVSAAFREFSGDVRADAFRAGDQRNFVGEIHNGRVGRIGRTGRMARKEKTG